MPPSSSRLALNESIYAWTEDWTKVGGSDGKSSYLVSSSIYCGNSMLGPPGEISDYY